MPIRTKDKEILLNFSYKLETESIQLSQIQKTRGQLSDLIDFIYLNLVKNSGNINYMVGKAILTPKNNEVEKISDLIINRLPSEVYTYYSANSVGLENGNVKQPQLYSPEFLRSLKICGLPSGELKLKVEILIMLLQNLDPSKGLCNGTQLICRRLLSKIIDMEIMTGSYIEQRIFIPTIILTLSDTSLPFTLM